MNNVACVVIGRNEGARLEGCLASVIAQCPRVLFVDSDSEDDSVGIAQRLGVPVLALDSTDGLGAARARNVGMEWIRREWPDAEYVQMVDGDAQLLPGWLARGVQTLQQQPEAAAVFGRLSERHRNESIYNALCDMEWAVPPGEVGWSGGIALVRATAFEAAGGFDPTLIAGEEPDLCLRWRDMGFSILCIDQPMALHDAAMTRFGQWWRRNVRAGYAYAEAVSRRPEGPAMDARRQVRSITAWGLVVPGAALALALPTLGSSVVLSAAGYAALASKIRKTMSARGFSSGDARLYAGFCVLGKVPQAAGLVRFHALRARGRRSGVIEHRGGT